MVTVPALFTWSYTGSGANYFDTPELASITYTTDIYTTAPVGILSSLSFNSVKNTLDVAVQCNHLGVVHWGAFTKDLTTPAVDLVYIKTLTHGGSKFYLPPNDTDPYWSVLGMQYIDVINTDVTFSISHLKSGTEY